MKALVSKALTGLAVATVLTIGMESKAHAQVRVNPYVVNQGFYISKVYWGHTAAQQGLEARDVIYRVDGIRIRSGNDLRWALQGKGRVRVEVLNHRENYRSVWLTLYPRFGKIGVNGYSINVDNLRPQVPYYLRRP